MPLLFASSRNRSLFNLFQSISRSYATHAASCIVLDKWLNSWELATPPVSFLPGTEPPTALSWLRRRGPALPNGMLHKLFREEQLRLYDPATSKVSRVKKAKELPAGAQILIPRELLSQVAEPTPKLEKQRVRRELSPEEEEQRMQWVRELRRRVLYHDADMIALDKPAGLAVQGGSGIPNSVDEVMRQAFGRLVVDSSQLRLVHRLDQATSGVLLIATNPDAATWLAQAFRSGSAAAVQSASDGSTGRADNSSAEGWELRKTYWAVVATALPPGRATDHWDRDARRLPEQGSIDLPVVPGDGGGILQNGRRHPGAMTALTKFTLRRQNDLLAWLELRPQTGRKHQLRIHCAHGLQAPVLGDSKYGPVRMPPQRPILRDLQKEGAWSPEDRPPMFLHCRSILLKKPGQEPIRVVAPPPSHWQTLFKLQRWRELSAAITKEKIASKRQSSTKR